MVRRWLLYGIALLGAVLLQIYSTYYLAAFLLALVAALPVLALLISLPAMLACKVRLRPSGSGVRRGAEAWFLVEMENGRHLPVSRVTLRLRIRNCLTSTERWKKLVLSGGSRGAFMSEPADTAHCGLLKCSVVQMRIYDCLGLFFFHRKLPEAADILVCPIPAEPEIPPELDGDRAGETSFHPRPGGGPGEDYDLRPYRPGDPVRMIHWKLSSKKEDVIIREVLEAVRAVPLLTFDHFGAPAALDDVLDRLDAISHALLEQQRSHWIRWAGPDGVFRDFHVSGEREWTACLTAILSEYAPEDGTSILENPACGKLQGSPVIQLHVAAGQGAEV